MPTVDVLNLVNSVGLSGNNPNLTGTTTSAVATGGTILLAFSWWDDSVGGLASVSSVTDNSGAAGSWTILGQGNNTNAADGIMIAKRTCPSGLASGITITVTPSVNTGGGVLMRGSSFLGLDGTTDVVTSIGSTSGTTFTAPTATTTQANDLIYCAVGVETLTTSNVSFSTGTLVGTQWDSGSQQGLGVGYSIANSAGGNTFAGNISVTSSATTMIVVALKSTVAASAPTLDYRFPDFMDFGPGDFGPNAFLEDAYPPLATTSGPVSFNMGTTSAIFTLSGLVPALRVRVSPPVAVINLTAQIGTRGIKAPGIATLNLQGITYSKLQALVKPPVTTITLSAANPTFKVRANITAQAIINFVGIVGTVPSTPVTFNMGTVNAVMNLSGIVPSLRARVSPPVATMTLAGINPKEAERAFPPSAILSLSAQVPRPTVREVPPQASLSLVGLTQTKTIVKVNAETAVLRLLSQPPIDPTALKATQIKIRALGEANQNASGETISR